MKSILIDFGFLSCGLNISSSISFFILLLKLNPLFGILVFIFPNAKFERIENGKHHKFQFKVFSATFQGKQIECKAKLTSENILYTMRLLS